MVPSNVRTDQDSLPAPAADNPAAGDWQPEQGTLSIKITSEFMEDYTSGQPWLPLAGITRREPILYTAANGNEVVYTFSDPPSISNQPLTVTRLYREQGGTTGWNTDSTTLPDDPAPSGDYPNETGTVAIILPGEGGVPDRLVIFRRFSLQIASLGPDGAFLGAFQVFGKQYSGVLVRGSIPAGSFHLPQLAGSFLPPFLQELNVPGRQIPINGQSTVFFQNSMAMMWNPQAVFPLYTKTPNTYRCIVVDQRGDRSADVVSLQLNLDQSNPSAPVFQVGERKVLTTSATGCVAVRQTVAGAVEVLLFDLPTVRSLSATYDPSGTAAASWQPETRASMAGDASLPPDSDKPGEIVVGQPDARQTFPLNLSDPNQRFSVILASSSQNQIVEAFFLIRDTNSQFPNLNQGPVKEVWTSRRITGGSWEEPRLLERSLADIRLFPADGVQFAACAQGTGLSFIGRDEDGEWDSELVRLASESGGPIDIAGYRVGINLEKQSVPAGGFPLKVTSSSHCVAILEQENDSGVLLPDYVSLSPARAVAASSDGNGILWIVVILQDRLSLPTLYINSDKFTASLEINLNRGLERFFTNITTDELTNATDPKSGQKLLTKPENADDARKAIAAAMTLVPENPAPHLAALAAHPLVSDVSARWVTATRGPVRIQVPSAAPCFHFHVGEDGAARFEALTSDVAQVRMAAAVASAASILDGFTSWISGAWNKLCDVVSVIVDGARTVVEVVIDGIKYLYDMVIEVVDQVLDLVAYILDAAGFLLGLAVNWLLKLLGFLFDWDAIKAKRNEMKQFVRDNIAQLTQKIPDPGVAVKSWVDSLSGLQDGLRAFRSTPDSNKSNGVLVSGLSAISKIFSIGDDSILPQATWMLDKVRSWFPRGPGLSAPAIGNLTQLLTDLSNAFLNAAKDLQDSVFQLPDAIANWITDPDVFSGGGLGSLLDWLINLVTSIIQLLKDVLAAAGNGLHAIWSAPGALIDWLDTSVKIPFFSGFYRGLTDNNFSPYDLICLLAAIPIAIGEQYSKVSAAATKPAAASTALFATTGGDGGVNRTAAQGFALAFTAMGVYTTAPDALFTALGGAGFIGTLFTVINLGLTLGSLTCMVAESEDVENYIVFPIAVAAGGLCDGLFSVVSRLEPARVHFVDVALLGAFGYFLYKVSTDSKHPGSKLLIPYHSLSMVQQALSLAVRYRVNVSKKPLTLIPAAIYAAAQTAINGAKWGIYCDYTVEEYGNS